MEFWKSAMEGMVSMSSWNGRSVLVTGATGMVGSWLVKRLINEKARITVLVQDYNPQSELIRSGDLNYCDVISGDLRNKGDVSRAVLSSDCEYIFHLGAQTIVGTAISDPIYTFETNIAGTWNLFDVIRSSRKDVRGVIVASSDKAYGSADLLPYDESNPLKGEGPYDLSKSCADLIARSYFLTYGIPTVIARCGNIYGGGDLNWSRIVPGTIFDLLNGNVPTIRSNGKFLRDYLFVEDVVSAYLDMATQISNLNVNGEAFNFSREEPLNVMQIYSAICTATVGKFVEPKILDTAKNEIVDQHLSSAKARNILKWESEVDLEQGLLETVSWYRKYLKV